MAGDDLTLRFVYEEGDSKYPTQYQGPPAPHPDNKSLVVYPDGSVGSPPPSMERGVFKPGPQGGVSGYINPTDLPRSQSREDSTAAGPRSALESIPSWMIPTSIREKMQPPTSPGPPQPVAVPVRTEIPGVPSWMIPASIQSRIDDESRVSGELSEKQSSRFYKRYPWKDPNFVPEAPPVWVAPVPPPLAPVSLVTPMPAGGGAGKIPPPPTTTATGPPPGEGDPSAWTNIPSFKTAGAATEFFQKYGRWPAPGDSPDNPMPGTPSGGAKKLSDFWKNLKEESLEPISRYGISSAAYAVGGGVGRLTGSPSAGIIAGASTRAGLSMAASAGLVSAGAVAAGTGLMLAIVGVIEAFQTLAATADSLAMDFAKVSGPIAATLAINQAQRTLQDIELAQRSSSELVDYLNAQNDFYMEWREYKTTVVTMLIPVVTVFLTDASILLKMLNSGNATLEKLTGSNLFNFFGLPPGSGLDIMFRTFKAVIAIGEWLSPGSTASDEVLWEDAINRFLDPSHIPSGPPMAPFPRPPRPRAGVF